jgi:hypothetical protein
MFAAERVADFGPAMIEVQIEKREAADELIVCAQSDAPF